MGISFYGKQEDGSAIMLDLDHPDHLSMNNANARAFLLFLGLLPGDDLCGEVPVFEARRAIVRARATFDRRVGSFTRSASDTKRPGQVRLVESSIDADYFMMRLAAFERFVLQVAGMGAIAVYWA